MLAIIKWVLTTIGFSALLIFCLFNRGAASLTLNPLTDPVVLPLALIILGGVVVGFVWGVVIMWVHGGKQRRAYKITQKELRVLQNQSAQQQLQQ